MSGPKKDEVSRQFRILHDEKLCDFFLICLMMLGQ
jgi:hypothetical protein